MTLREMTRTARAALLLLLLAAALTACQTPRHGPPAGTRGPQKSETLADEAYRLLRPRVGEMVDAPNPNDEPERMYVGDRLLEISIRNPEWDMLPVLDPAVDDSQLSYQFRDGSLLVLTTAPLPGQHLPPPGPDTGTKLVRARVVPP